jgi:hypothetical protein
MYADDIRDGNSLHRWQGKIDSDFHRKSLSVVYRATSRIFPLVVAAPRNGSSNDHERLLAFRSLLISGVVAALGNGDLAEAGYSASSALNRATGLAASQAAVAALARTVLAAGDPASAFDGPVSAAAQALEGFIGANVEEFWSEVRFDALLIDSGSGPLLRPLWSSTLPEWFGSPNSVAQSFWKTSDPETWSFWLRWWEGVLSGNQLDWDLQKEVALIPDAIWQQGPVAVAAAIRQIERHLADLAEPDLIEKDLAALPASPRWQIAHFKDTVALHREDIPPTLDALLEYCGREIDRLQGRNAPYSSVEEEEEAQRQIRVLTSIFSTLRKLRETIPSDGALNDKDAERGERLTRLFVRLIRQWPSKNAEDLVDSVYRAALVGLTATLGPMIGVPAAVATGAGVALFGGKKIADGIKAAKDLGDMASKP